MAAAVSDPEVLADMEKRKLPVQFRTGEQLQAFIKQALDTPPETVKTFLEIVGTK
jgi:tripartite-type tricarboxylate transporter receptor subunit TctC